MLKRAIVDWIAARGITPVVLTPSGPIDTG
jgi:hypothetical protein